MVKSMLSTGLVFVVAMFCLAHTGTGVSAGPGTAVGTMPIKIKSSGGKKEKGQEIKGTTASTPEVAKGKLTMDVQNASGQMVNDFHICLETVGGAKATTATHKIDQIQVNPEPGGTNMPSYTYEGLCVTAKCNGDDMLDVDKRLSVTVRITKADGTPVTGQEVVLRAHWTKDGVMVCNTSTDDIGADRPPTGLLSVVPDYNPATVESEEGVPVVTCNDICLAERDGYRFQRGSLVFKPDNGMAFQMDGETSVFVYNQDGDAVTDPAIISISNRRIDDRGNFVFDVTRAPGGLHVVLVIRGLKVSGLGNAMSGDEVYSGVSGAAVSGACMDRLYRLIAVVEAE